MQKKKKKKKKQSEQGSVRWGVWPHHVDQHDAHKSHLWASEALFDQGAQQVLNKNYQVNASSV
jgi:hypothetical protein